VLIPQGVTARARSLSALMYWIDEGMEANDTCTCPPIRHACTWMGRPVTLTVTEFLILQVLATRPGVVKSRNALMDAAYSDNVHVDDRTIDSHIKRLRKKFIAVDHAFDMIDTLYGVGYRYRVEVDPSEDLVEDLAADIVEEHVDPVGAKLRKPREDYSP